MTKSAVTYFDPCIESRKYLIGCKGIRKPTGTTFYPVSKAQSKYVPKGKVFSSSLNKVSAPSKSSITVSNQSSTGSSAIELEVGNICDKEKEKDVSFEDSKFISSSWKVEILKEEEVIEVSSSFEESQEEESNISELELEQVLEVAPYLNREILTEEDIKSVLSLLHQNPEIQSIIRTHQDLTSFFSEFIYWTLNSISSTGDS